MTITWGERPKSREGSIAEQRLILHYVLTGEWDASTARNYALAFAPSTVDGLYRMDVQPQPQGGGVTYFDVAYGPFQRTVGQWSFRCTGSGASETIRASRAMRSKSSGAPDTQSLNIDETGKVQGVEILVPQSVMEFTYRYASGAFTLAVARSINALVAKTNSTTWNGFAAGELLIMSAEAMQGTGTEAEAKISMGYRPNETNITVDSATLAAKRGWDILDIRWKDVVVGGVSVKQAQYLYAQQVYEEIDYNTALGF